MALIVGSRIHSLREVLNDSGPVHTVQEKITSEIIVGVPSQFEEDNEKDSQSRSQTTTVA
jgi:hypothetical protein